jgi:hypothetical protein
MTLLCIYKAILIVLGGSQTEIYSLLIVLLQNIVALAL